MALYPKFITLILIWDSSIIKQNDETVRYLTDASTKWVTWIIEKHNQSKNPAPQIVKFFC